MHSGAWIATLCTRKGSCWTLNPKVTGSTPVRPTKFSTGCVILALCAPLPVPILYHPDRLLGRQAQYIDPGLDGTVVQASPAAGLAEAYPIPIDLDHPRPARVVGLFRSRYPLAVFWLIVAVYINPLDRVTFGSGSHVRKEVPEVKPAITHRDPSRAVILESMAASSKAPVLHVSPRSIGWSLVHTVLVVHNNLPKRHNKD